jgi:hypothetical protein
VYQPKIHKTARKNKRRILVFGAKEQAILAQYIAKKAPDSFIFRPIDVVLESKKLCEPTAKHSRHHRKKAGYDVHCVRQICHATSTNRLLNSWQKRINGFLAIHR